MGATGRTSCQNGLDKDDLEDRVYLMEISSVLVEGVWRFLGLTTNVVFCFDHWAASRARALRSTLCSMQIINCCNSSKNVGMSSEGATVHELFKLIWIGGSRWSTVMSFSFSDSDGGFICFSNSKRKAVIWSAWAFSRFSLTSKRVCNLSLSSSTSDWRSFSSRNSFSFFSWTLKKKTVK